MTDSTENNTGMNFVKQYCKDIVFNYEKLTTAYVPLFGDVFQKESTLLSHETGTDFRNEIGIVEAERKLKRFVLTGDPGTGKTTSLHYLSLFHARRISEALSDNDLAELQALSHLKIASYFIHKFNVFSFGKMIWRISVSMSKTVRCSREVLTTGCFPLNVP